MLYEKLVQFIDGCGAVCILVIILLSILPILRSASRIRHRLRRLERRLERCCLEHVSVEVGGRDPRL